MGARILKSIELLVSPRERRYDHDVTNTVDVSSTECVREAVRELFDETWPDASFDIPWIAFHDFETLFEGGMNGYRGCDTVYHDIQHTLDVTLALARLMAGYEQTVDDDERLGAERAILGLIVALFHDSGYILSSADETHYNGAELTLTHVSRSADFIADYLPTVGLRKATRIAVEIVHFTGYEKALEDIELDDPLDSLLGHLLGTADLVAQMADRCYLEKCRDRLYPEFVLGGIAIAENPEGRLQVRYQSGEDLLLQTPRFFREVAMKRLNMGFNRAYRYVEALYDGKNPYMEFVERNIAYLEYIIQTGEWPKLRRSPPCFTIVDNPISTTNVLVNQHIERLREIPAVLGQA